MPKAKPRTTARAKPTYWELKRWCIEQASRWPTTVEGGAAGVYSAGGNYRHVEADLLGRAQRILDWVSK